MLGIERTAGRGQEMPWQAPPIATLIRNAQQRLRAIRRNAQVLHASPSRCMEHGYINSPLGSRSGRRAVAQHMRDVADVIIGLIVLAEILVMPESGPDGPRNAEFEFDARTFARGEPAR